MNLKEQHNCSNSRQHEKKLSNSTFYTQQNGDWKQKSFGTRCPRAVLENVQQSTEGYGTAGFVVIGAEK